MEDRRKTIALYPIHEKKHNIYNSTIDLLKENYNVLYSPIDSGNMTLFTKLSRNPFLLSIYHKHIRPFVSVNNLRAFFGKNKIEEIPDCDLLFFTNTMPTTMEKKFIIDLEMVNSISGYDIDRLDRVKLKESFSHENCKAIICWNEICKRSLIDTIDCSDFVNKIIVLPFGINPEKVDRKYDKDVQLIFVSSINNPLDFERKGGIIALEAYAQLVKKYPNLKFVIRAHVPDWIKEKYGALNGLKIINEFISTEELKNLMRETDILFEPLPGINLTLECMSFAIPMIAMDLWAIPEMIIDGKNGFIVDGKEVFGDKGDITTYMRDMNINYLKMYNKEPSEKIVSNFVKAGDKLIKNLDLREKMSKYSISLVGGDEIYSLERRNKELKKIVESSL